MSGYVVRRFNSFRFVCNKPPIYFKFSFSYIMLPDGCLADTGWLGENIDALVSSDCERKLTGEVEHFSHQVVFDPWIGVASSSTLTSIEGNLGLLNAQRQLP